MITKRAIEKLSFLTLVLTFCSCASHKVSLYNDTQKESIKYQYYIKYPVFKGVTKSLAVKKRKKFIDEAIQNILISIYRTADYGNLDFDEIQDVSYPNIPFTIVKKAPITFSYKPVNIYGSVEGKVLVWEKPEKKYYKTWRAETLKPIAYVENKTIFLPNKNLRNKIEKKFILLKKSEIKEAIKLFDNNFDIVGGKQLLRKFWQSIKLPEVVSKASETNPDIYEIFKSYKNISPTGMGVAQVEVNEKNTLKFILSKYEHSPFNNSTDFSLTYDPVKFLWGVIFVLNSEIKIARIDKETVKVNIRIPVNEILNKYNIKDISDFIE